MIKIDQIGVGIQVANFEGLGSPQGARGLIRGLQICELYFDNILIPYTKGFLEIWMIDLRQFFDRTTDMMLSDVIKINTNIVKTLNTMPANFI